MPLILKCDNCKREILRDYRSKQTLCSDCRDKKTREMMRGYYDNLIDTYESSKQREENKK